MIAFSFYLTKRISTKIKLAWINCNDEQEPEEFLVTGGLDDAVRDKNNTLNYILAYFLHYNLKFGKPIFYRAYVPKSYW